MRSLVIGIVALLGIATLLSAQTPAPPSTSPNLSVLAFLTKQEWEAQLPATPDGKEQKIHAQFTWSQNRQAIRICNQFVIDGKPQPYLDGLYAWDPQRRAIVFWYVDAKGGLTKGELKTENGKLVHEFDQLTPDGKSAAYVAKVTPHGEQVWENEIFERHGTELKSVVKVRYEAAGNSSR